MVNFLHYTAVVHVYHALSGSTHSIRVAQPSTSCKSCPTGAYCKGEDKIEALVRLNAESERPDQPLKRISYWRVSNKSSVFYTCPMPEGCRGTTMCPLVKIDDGMDGNDRADFIAQRCATIDVSSSETFCPDKRCLAFLPDKTVLKCHQNEVDTTRGECVVDRKLENAQRDILAPCAPHASLDMENLEENVKYARILALAYF